MSYPHRRRPVVRILQILPADGWSYVAASRRAGGPVEAVAEPLAVWALVEVAGDIECQECEDPISTEIRGYVTHNGHALRQPDRVVLGYTRTDDFDPTEWQDLAERSFKDDVELPSPDEVRAYREQQR